jgi:hypothetical protein
MAGLRALLLAVLMGVSLVKTPVAKASEWTTIAPKDVSDDDLARHAGEPGFLDGLSLSEMRFFESGFGWHLLRFVNVAKPDGPLWAVLHDDENAAFEAMINAVKTHGGTGIVVNSGAGSARLQIGHGTCGGRLAIVDACDPNRNFSDATPLFTGAFLKQLASGKPIIALHTNAPHFTASSQSVTILDKAAYGKGKIKARAGGYFGNGSVAVLNNPDSFVYLPYLPSNGIAAKDATCRKALNSMGIHVYHEPVIASASKPSGDGSLSNYITIRYPAVAYINAESRREADLALAAKRHELMIDAYLHAC